MNYFNSSKDIFFSSATNKLEIIKNQLEKKNNFEFHNKYKNIKNIIEEFIIKKNLILYGGGAINLALPLNKQFYNKYNSIPDYDLFSTNAKNDAIELANILYKKTKIKEIIVTTALHKGTYKVKYDTYSFVDLTYINKDDYDRFLLLTQLKTNKNLLDINTKIKIAPLEVIKFSFHLEFAKPYSSAFRWDKIYNRIKIFDKFYLPNKSQLIKNLKKNQEIYNCTDNNIIKILDFIINLPVIKNLPIIGTYAFTTYFNKIICKNNNDPLTLLLKNIFTKYNLITNSKYFVTSYLSILSNEPLSLANKLIKNLNEFIENLFEHKKYKFIIEETLLNKLDDFIEDNTKMKKYRIYLLNYNIQKIPLIDIFSVNACFTTLKIDNNLFGSIETILAYHYHSILFFHPLDNYNKNCCLSLIADLLSYIIYDKNFENIKHFFSLECYGHELSFHAIKKQQIYDPFHKFKYIPTYNTKLI